MPDEDYTEYAPPASQPKSEQEKPGIGETDWNGTQFVEDFGLRLLEELGDEAYYLQVKIDDWDNPGWIGLLGIYDKQGVKLDRPGFDLSDDDSKALVWQLEDKWPPMWPPPGLTDTSGSEWTNYINLHDPNEDWQERG